MPRDVEIEADQMELLQTEAGRLGISVAGLVEVIALRQVSTDLVAAMADASEVAAKPSSNVVPFRKRRF